MLGVSPSGMDETIFTRDTVLGTFPRHIRRAIDPANHADASERCANHANALLAQLGCKAPFTPEWIEQTYGVP